MKHDVANLIEHVKGGAKSTVQIVADQIERRVRSLRQQGGAEGERSAKAVGRFVEEQLFLALMIAVGIGYIGALDPSASAVHSYGCPFGPPGNH